MDEFENQELIGSPNQNLAATMEKLMGVANQAEFLNEERKPRAELIPSTIPTSINQEQVIQLLKAKMASLEAKKASYKISHEYSKAEDMEKNLMECGVALTTAEGKTTNIEPLTRVITKIVNERIKSVTEERVSSFSRVASQLRNFKTDLANNFLTKALSIDYKKR